MKTSLKRLTSLGAFLALLPLYAELTPIRLIEGMQPAYPEELKATGEDGEARIRAIVDETGSVGEASIESASNPAFGQAALEAVRKWRFQPAEKDGEPVPQTVVIPLIFKLSLKDRLNALAGREVFVDIDSLTDKVHTWKDVKRYFPLRKNQSRVIPYPEELRGSGLSEEIAIQCILTPEGLVLNPSLLNLQHREFALPAILHVVNLKFERPKLDGQPIYLQQKIKLIVSETPEKMQ